MLVRRRGGFASVARRSSTRPHWAGIAHGSSTENGARRTSSVSGTMWRWMIRSVAPAAAYRVQATQLRTMGDPELDELKREFLAEAQAKVREMQSKLAGARDRQVLDRLIYLAHQLKGSGGSYGFQRISTESAELEKGIERLANGENDSVEESVQQHVSNLRAEIEQGTRELASLAGSRTL